MCLCFKKYVFVNSILRKQREHYKLLGLTGALGVMGLRAIRLCSGAMAHKSVRMQGKLCRSQRSSPYPVLW